MSKTKSAAPAAAQPIDTPSPPTEKPVGRVGKSVRWARSSNVFWISVALGLLVILFSLITPAGTFLTAFNLKTLALDSTVILILAAGATIVIVTGGIDISIGSVLTFSAAASLLTMKGIASDGGSDVVAIAVGLGVAVGAGMAWGLLNGLLVARAGINPLVVTLATFGAALGAARLLTDGANPSGVPQGLQEEVGFGEIAGVPIPFVIALVVVTACGILLAKTRFGERSYLVGSNEEAARRGGISVPYVRVMVYALGGALAGFAGFIEIARFDVAEVSTGHTTVLLAAIAAVVIGGASLSGGVGSMLGTVIGVFIPVVLNNGLIISGVQRFWQEIAVGFILVVAVGFDQWRRRRESLTT